MLDTLQLTTEQVNKLVAMTCSASRGGKSSGTLFPELVGVWSNETGALRIHVQWWSKFYRYGRKILEKGSTSVYEWRQVGIDGNESDPWDWFPV